MVSLLIVAVFYPMIVLGDEKSPPLSTGKLILFREALCCAVSSHGDTLTGTRESPVQFLRSPLKADWIF